MLDRYALYERCVQGPDELVGLLRAIHGGDPKVLGEDFCGTAALSAAWVRLVPNGRAIAVDHDPEPLTRARRHAGVKVIEGDVGDPLPPTNRVDVLHVGNFSIGEWRTRDTLVAYLRHGRARLEPGGILLADLYGGDTAFLAGKTEREFPGPGGRTILYTWEQRSGDPLTGDVVNALHFEVRRKDGDIEQTLRDAFVYRWRLWGVPELRDAMRDAGFARTEVFPKVPDAIDDEGVVHVQPLAADDLEDSFDVLVVGHV